MQLMRFSNGGYVIHRLTGSWNGRISAWFDAKGRLLDCERIDGANRSQPVKRDGPIWQHVASVGVRHVK